MTTQTALPWGHQKRTIGRHKQPGELYNLINWGILNLPSFYATWEWFKEKLDVSIRTLQRWWKGHHETWGFTKIRRGRNRWYFARKSKVSPHEAQSVTPLRVQTSELKTDLYCKEVLSQASSTVGGEKTKVGTDGKNHNARKGSGARPEEPRSGNDHPARSQAVRGRSGSMGEEYRASPRVNAPSPTTRLQPGTRGETLPGLTESRTEAKAPRPTPLPAPGGDKGPESYAGGVVVGTRCKSTGVSQGWTDNAPRSLGPNGGSNPPRQQTTSVSKVEISADRRMPPRPELFPYTRALNETPWTPATQDHLRRLREVIRNAWPRIQAAHSPDAYLEAVLAREWAS